MSKPRSIELAFSGKYDQQHAQSYLHKHQDGHLYRSLRHPLGRPTIMRELHAYQAFAELGVNVPKLVYGSARKHQGQWQGLLITQALAGFISLEQWYEAEQSAEHSACMINALAGALAKHLFIRIEHDESGSPRAEIALLDLEKSRRRWRSADASRHDMRQLKRHCGAMPEGDWPLLMQAYTAALAT